MHADGINKAQLIRSDPQQLGIPSTKHKLQAIIIFLRTIVGVSKANYNVWICRLGGVQPVWNWHGEVRHLHDPWLVWKQVLHGDRHQEIWRKPYSFSNGWQRRFHLLQIATNQNISEPDEENVSVVAGVWGSAFSILFNRVLGVKDTAGGSTMEEELGTVIVIIIKR